MKKLKHGSRAACLLCEKRFRRAPGQTGYVCISCNEKIAEIIH